MTDIEELELIRSIVERSPAIIFRWAIEEDWPVEFVSENISQLGYTREDFLSGRVSWPAITHPDDCMRLEKEVESYIAGGVDSWSQTYRIRTAGGVYRWMRDWNLLLRDGQDVPQKIQGITIDVTAQKNAEHKLEERSLQLARLAEELTLVEYRERRRVADYLHDNLQQLLVGARMQAHALGSLHGTPTDHALSRLNAILAEAIDASRIATRDIAAPVGTERNLADGFQSLVRDAKERYQLKVDARIQVDDTLNEAPEAVIVLLFTAARELLLNVVKHAGTLRATLRLVRNADGVLLEVCDAGGGVAAAVTGGTESRGFGLLGIRERVELLGGSFQMESTPDRGTRVALTLPLPSVTASPPVTGSHWRASPRGGILKGTRNTLYKPEGARLVFADDHQIVRESLVNLLDTHGGIDVVGQAGNGQEAVDCAERLQPDIVVMDVNMPVMDGIEATRIIKRCWPEIKVIGLSMFDEEDRGARMREAGADDYVTKSGSPEQLIEAINRCI